MQRQRTNRDITPITWQRETFNPLSLTARSRASYFGVCRRRRRREEEGKIADLPRQPRKRGRKKRDFHALADYRVI